MNGNPPSAAVVLTMEGGIVVITDYLEIVVEPEPIICPSMKM